MTFTKTFLSLLLITTLCVSCISTKSTSTTFWVNSKKTDCNTGAGKTQCLQIHKGHDLNITEWTPFHSSIENFAFELGYLQKIKVKKTSLKTTHTPFDTSSTTYKLVKVLEKKQDPKIILHDIWAATSINRNVIKAKNNTPTLEINLTKMQVFGTDGCNNFTGSIRNLTANTIMFNTLASTRKMCLDMQIPDIYNKALINSVSYKHESLNLFFYDANGRETIHFKKVD
ncbi:hypothetical protein APS56_05045 [Pseudalgibacter alginicilyticus]|uniref:DUF306 domain-containing protein n=1 Tax=Pseudalgibacter alginicilyticus TaxID=1736674 RepID=A0A0P0CVU0_9FLAO|nr:DUF4377 domain-containing protein [Pseudalgibacter alginicilyticus]ALJ04545.1 hypothetical protein APS56_05045 [Pseudalgibacter alginicilyticus]